MNLTEQEKGYIAGLIDGEGTIGMGKTFQANGDRKLRYRLRLTITTTNSNLTIWFTDKLGIGCNVQSYKRENIKHANWFYLEFKRLNLRGPKSVTTNTSDINAFNIAIMKIESELCGDVQRAIGDNAPPTIQ
jgi:hypothetical protein